MATLLQNTYKLKCSLIHTRMINHNLIRAMSNEIPTLIKSKHYGFLGSGKMSQALVKGFLSSGIIKGCQITMSDRFGASFPNAEFMIPINEIRSQYGVEYIQSNEPVAKNSDIIFACVKPNVLLSVLKNISDYLSDKLLVSIAAGITLDQIQQVVPKSTRIIRVMPNTPCLVQVGTAVYACSSIVTPEDTQLLETLCKPIFPVFESLPESLFNAAIAVSGSSPAYIYIIAEALIDGGVMLGLSRPIAHRLVVNTILGSATMLRETGQNPTELKNDVCSPGGTTIQGVYALEQGGIRATLMNTVERVAARGDELSKPK